MHPQTLSGVVVKSEAGAHPQKAASGLGAGAEEMGEVGEEVTKETAMVVAATRAREEAQIWLAIASAETVDAAARAQARAGASVRVKAPLGFAVLRGPDGFEVCNLVICVPAPE